MKNGVPVEVQQTIKYLKKRGFEAEFFKEPNLLLQKLTSIVSQKTLVGFGGSFTLRELGIPQKLKEMGVRTLDHWEEGLSQEQVIQFRLDQGRSDLFITSVNACTQDGRLVLVDGVGNRVSASVFGPKRVVHILGVNKIVEDIHKAFERVRTIAAPKRAQSLGIKVPCVKKGECKDCFSPQRICRATVILDYAPAYTPSSVWIVDGAWGY